MWNEKPAPSKYNKKKLVGYLNLTTWIVILKLIQQQMYVDNHSAFHHWV